MENQLTTDEHQGETTSKHHLNEFLKTVQPSAVDAKELDVVLKMLFKWIGEKSYVPTSQETRISLSYNMVPLASCLCTSYVTSLGLRKLGLPRGVLHTFPVALVALSTIASTSNYARKAVNYRLMQLHTPMGNRMIEITQDYRAYPQKYDEISKLDMLSFRKFLSEDKKRNEVDKNVDTSDNIHPSNDNKLNQITHGFSNLGMSSSMGSENEQSWGEKGRDMDDFNVWGKDLDKETTYKPWVTDNSRSESSLWSGDFREKSDRHQSITHTPNYIGKSDDYQRDYDYAHSSYDHHENHPHPFNKDNTNTSYHDPYKQYISNDNAGSWYQNDKPKSSPSPFLSTWDLDEPSHMNERYSQSPNTQTGRFNPKNEGKFKTWDDIRHQSSSSM